MLQLLDAAERDSSMVAVDGHVEPGALVAFHVLEPAQGVSDLQAALTAVRRQLGGAPQPGDTASSSATPWRPDSLGILFGHLLLRH